MIEVAINVTVSIGAIMLFSYWFRYMCRLVLSAAASQDCAASVTQTHHLCFREAQLRLRYGATELDWLKEMLDRDYAVVAGLLSHAENSQPGIERRMLAIHYSLAAVWFKASSKISTAAARAALQEMSLVIAYFANSVGEASAAAAPS